MIFVMECCIIGFNDELNVISYLKINGFNSLFYLEIFWVEVMKVYYDNSVGGVYFGIEKVMVVMKLKYYWLCMY